MGPQQSRFYELLAARHPVMTRGVHEARSVSPSLVDQYFEECLGWIIRAHGEDVLQRVVDGYASFTLEVNRAQLAYEKRGRYEYSSFADADTLVYQRTDYMREYYWGVFAILFCWSHYVELMEFFLRRFVERLSPGKLIEIAPGHGAWGVLATKANENTTLEGWDISPASLELAPKMAFGAGIENRCIYRLGDATQIDPGANRYDSAICSFMLEHLEEPGRFLASFAPCLRSGGLAFVTLALTAAQTDHIYEFRRESEGVLLAEAAGFELLECRVARPRRLATGARFVPRIQGMILRKQ